ncbi:P-loop containing nucleoside triphosphate hydrolase protein [Dactylonectria macrodidyma]|uniref:P-loop containing nucleoside triphosphate hydrolase protein n=1 Tax=Dactylonectria macrodidyma TaxID=307937 RepID=A0A9P9J2G2_9HYPO|nr:P-loop containing nucleoside triphosphate hydrolase protein [Dactylonectria macrodidyma]
MFKGDTRKGIPRGAVEMEGVLTYLQNHTNLGFVVLEVYRFNSYSIGEIFDKVGAAIGTLNKDYRSLETASRAIYVSPIVESAISSIMKACPERFPGFERLSNPNTSRHEQPYTFFYLYHSTLMEFLSGDTLNELEKRHFGFVLEWMENNARADWNEADELFAQGKVNSKHYAKLFRPGELVVWPDYFGKGTTCASVVGDFPHINFPAYEDSSYITCYVWDFSGKFSRLLDFISSKVEKCLNTDSVHKSEDEAVNILHLSKYPLRFAEDGLRMKLVARGEKLWQLRRKTLVCIKEQNDHFQAERRCMIDYDMYDRLHSNSETYPHEETSWMENRPDDSRLACLNPKILGFDFSKKTWRNFGVDDITHVTWNKAAFKQLVAPEETKELVMAMVTEHGQRASATMDIIEGKGQGLLILLHGGPGTGKTLTAESIAELQERPLYRVTCGDIGIEPKEVEQYLGDVLELGRTWGLVLLDEADVFLEERSFTDQKRNAVISIFLRVLEYYDGILILTTNRVGSFDEAFKSRIQLALAYPRLNEEDRLKIWNNFVQMLPRSGERVDMADLRLNLPKLARVDINGRQIRNVVTMARHLAKYRKEMLRAEHMQDAVRSVERFNEYLSDVKGIHDDERARGLTLR